MARVLSFCNAEEKILFDRNCGGGHGQPRGAFEKERI